MTDCARYIRSARDLHTAAEDDHTTPVLSGAAFTELQQIPLGMQVLLEWLAGAPTVVRGAYKDHSPDLAGEKREDDGGQPSTHQLRN